MADNYWNETINSAAARHIPSFFEQIRGFVLTTPLLAAIATFVILVYMRPQFVQRNHSSKIALPTINYTTVLIASFIVFMAVLLLPKCL